MLHRGRLITAFRAGLVAYLLSTFVLLLALLPWHAGHSEFPGHEHAPGTPDHFHGLQQVVGWMLSGSVLVVIITSLPSFTAVRPLPASWREQLRPRRGNASRAPPAGAAIL